MTIYRVVYFDALNKKSLKVTDKAFKKRKSAVGAVRKWKAKGEHYVAYMKELPLIG